MGSSSFTEAFLKSGSLHPSPFPDRASMEQGFHADEFAGGGCGGIHSPGLLTTHCLDERFCSFRGESRHGQAAEEIQPFPERGEAP